MELVKPKKGTTMETIGSLGQMVAALEGRSDGGVSGGLNRGFQNCVVYYWVWLYQNQVVQGSVVPVLLDFLFDT